MPSIRQLTPSVVNKIAAGEVIERPASVVKELMENAVDAGAMRIDVGVSQGGVELIRVVDNGCGIAADELQLAVAPHATSKISDADDLFRIGTLGFRGEALASIAEISRTVLRSRASGADAGAELEITGGQQRPISPCGCPTGTLIEVHNLFFNTPVRRKFLRATQTEMGHVTEAFTRLALAYPDRHFTLRHQEKLMHDLPPTSDWLTRIAAFFGGELADQLLRVESRDGDLRLAGYVANPSQSRANNRMQFLFLNGRAIRDRSLQHALTEAYRGLLLTGRYPIAFLEIEMPADAVDVNVHPTKLEVRFQDGGRIYSQLLGTLRTRFLTTDLTARLQPVGASAAAGGSMADFDRPEGDSAGVNLQVAHDPTGAHDPAHSARLQTELVAWAKGQLGAAGAAVGEFVPFPAPVNSLGGASVHVPRPHHAPLELVPLDRSRFAGDILQPSAVSGVALEAMPVAETARPTAWRSPATQAIQVHDRYLIAETDDGMVVIDQHALHERVLYEQIREKVLAGALESQRLLVPEPVDLSPAEYAAAISEQQLIQRLGVEIEPFGGETVLVVSYPAMLGKLRPAEVLRSIVERLVDEGKAPDRRDLLDELLHMISCKAAIKAGDPLTSDEIAALVQQRHLAQDSHHCPHGRPTALVFTRDQLDKQFKRT